MKLKQILEGALAAGSIAYPPLSAAIPIINAFLEPSKKLIGEASGEQVNSAIMTLPHDKQLILMEAEIDVAKTEVLEFTKVQTVLNAADANGSSTRPQIAKDFSRIVAFVVISIITMFVVSVINKDYEALKLLQNNWQLILATIGPLLLVIRSYFGMRTDEKKARQYSAFNIEKPNLLERFASGFGKR
jgi:hypothetical protein